MRMTEAAAAYAAGVRHHGPWGRHRQEALVAYFEGPSSPGIPKRPSVVVSDNPYWDQLDDNTKDWLAATLSVYHDTERFMKMAINAIIGHTNTTFAEAEHLAYCVKNLTRYFSDEERAAVRYYWSEALYVDRFIPGRRVVGGRALGKK